MFIILNSSNIIIDICEDVRYAKPGNVDGGLQETSIEEATHIWNFTDNVAYMKNDVVLKEIDSIPEDFEPGKYKYINEEIILNEEYIPYVSLESRIAALEDIVNMLLLGGINNG